MKLVALQEEGEERSFALSVRAQRKGHVGTQREGGCLQGRKRALTRNRTGRHLELGLLASRSVRQCTFVM